MDTDYMAEMAYQEFVRDQEKEVTDEQVEIVCRELFGEHVSECLHLHVKQALKKAFENESLQNNN